MNVYLPAEQGIAKEVKHMMLKVVSKTQGKRGNKRSQKQERRGKEMPLTKKGEKLRNGLQGKLQGKGRCMAGAATNGREYTGAVRRVIPGDLFLRFSQDWSQRRASALPQCLRAA